MYTIRELGSRQKLKHWLGDFNRTRSSFGTTKAVKLAFKILRCRSGSGTLESCRKEKDCHFIWGKDEYTKSSRSSKHRAERVQVYDFVALTQFPKNGIHYHIIGLFLFFILRLLHPSIEGVAGMSLLYKFCYLLISVKWAIYI